MFSWNILLGAGTAGAGAEGGSQSLLPTLVTFGLIFVVFYFLIIRPQSKRQKETQKMLQALKKGDRVQTIGGIQGTVQTVREQIVVIRVSDNVDMEFTKNAVSSIVSVAAASTRNSARASSANRSNTENLTASKKKRVTASGTGTVNRTTGTTSRKTGTTKKTQENKE